MLNKPKWDFRGHELLQESLNLIHAFPNPIPASVLFCFTSLYYPLKAQRSKIRNGYSSHDWYTPTQCHVSTNLNRNQCYDYSKENYIFCRGVWQKLLRLIQILRLICLVSLFFFFNSKDFSLTKYLLKRWLLNSKRNCLVDCLSPLSILIYSEWSEPKCPTHWLPLQKKKKYTFTLQQKYLFSVG